MPGWIFGKFFGAGRGLGVAVFWGALGCGPAITAVPSEGGPTWHRVQSAHFVVDANVGASAAESVARELERLHDALSTAPWIGHGPLREPVHVVALGTRREAEAYGGTDVAGRYHREAPLDPLIVTHVGDTLASQTIAHELAHLLGRESSLNQPGWLTEGLASYVETVQFDAATSEAIFGAPNQGWLQVAELTSARTLFDPRERDPSPNALFTTSWALVHHLVSSRPAGFEAFQSLVAQGEPWRTAWGTALSPLDESALDGALHDYLKKFKYEARRFRVPRNDRPMTIRNLEELEVRVDRALLWATAPDVSDATTRVKHEVDAVLEVIPHDVRANVVSYYYGGGPPDPTRARWLSQTSPQDWRVWVMLADAEKAAGSNAAVTLAALDEALRLNPRATAALTRKARLLHDADKRDEALAAANQAVHADPTSPTAVTIARQLLAEAGRCSEAAAMHERARAFALVHGAHRDVERVLAVDPCR